MKKLHRGEKGFTLFELVITIAILAITTTIVAPNVAGFMNSSTLNAARTEAESVKTAASAYLAEFEEWPTDSTQLTDFLDGDTKATYEFGGDTGIEGVSAQEWKYIHWDADSQTWAIGEATG